MTDVLACLTGGNDLKSVTLRRLQEFLWYELPTTWPEAAGLAPAVGEVFDSAGLPHHAGLCRAAITCKVHAAYERGIAQGVAAFEDAKRRSGLVPPDLPPIAGRPLLAWGTAMGPKEAAAYESTAAALEQAVIAGTLRPPAPGWRLRQREIAARHLGDALLDAVFDERIQRWVDSGGARRAQLARVVAPRLRQPIPTPPQADAAVEPLRWLLAEIGSGITLTRTDRLPRTLATRGAERFGWPVTSTEVLDLHEIAWRIGALRRSAHRLFLSPAGHRLMALPAELWRAAAAQLVPPDNLIAVVSELALILLCDTSPTRLDDLVARILRFVPHPMEAMEAESARRLLQPLFRPAHHLGVVTFAEGTIALTPLGQPAGLIALQARATAPR
jgi:hypothetical protein